MRLEQRLIRSAAIAVCLMASGAVDAQTVEPRKGWELELRGGWVRSALSSDRSARLPVEGGSITTSSPVFPARRVSSWLFGDGARQLNDVIGELGQPGRFTPLDSILGQSGLDDVFNIGASLRRVVGPRVALEFGIDAIGRGRTPSAELVRNAQATRESFTTALTDVLGTALFTGLRVDSLFRVREAVGRDVALTGAVRYLFGVHHGWSPHFSVGAGVVIGGGEYPAIEIETDYRFSILGAVPIHENDRVALRFVPAAVFAGVVGTGVTRELGERWGLNVDGRLWLGPPANRPVLDAHPSIISGTPAGFVESLTNPNIQFSNNASTGRVSTLSGPAIEGFKAASGGLQVRVLVTAGVIARF